MFGLYTLEGQCHRILGHMNYVRLGQQSGCQLLVVFVPFDLEVKQSMSRQIRVDHPVKDIISYLDGRITFDHGAQQVVPLRLMKGFGKFEGFNHGTNCKDTT